MFSCNMMYSSGTQVTRLLSWDYYRTRFICG